MSDGKYILDENGEPKLEADLYKWGLWMENAKEKLYVKRDWVTDEILVSTMFLGLDFNP